MCPSRFARTTKPSVPNTLNPDASQPPAPGVIHQEDALRILCGEGQRLRFARIHLEPVSGGHGGIGFHHGGREVLTNLSDFRAHGSRDHDFIPNRPWHKNALRNQREQIERVDFRKQDERAGIADDDRLTHGRVPRRDPRAAC